MQSLSLRQYLPAPYMPFISVAICRELLALGRIVRCRQRRAELQQVEGPPRLRVELLVVIRHGLLDHFAVPLRVTLAFASAEMAVSPVM